MKSGKQRVQWSAEKFASVAKAQRQSKLSVQAFCLREGVNLSSFYRWRDRVGSRRSVAQRVVAQEEASGGEFIALGTVPSASRLELRFDLGGGMTLTVTR